MSWPLVLVNNFVDDYRIGESLYSTRSYHQGKANFKCISSLIGKVTDMIVHMKRNYSSTFRGTN